MRPRRSGAPRSGALPSFSFGFLLVRRSSFEGTYSAGLFVLHMSYNTVCRNLLPAAPAMGLSTLVRRYDCRNCFGGVSRTRRASMLQLTGDWLGQGEATALLMVIG